jgi:hypothetical protein
MPLTVVQSPVGPVEHEAVVAGYAQSLRGLDQAWRNARTRAIVAAAELQPNPTPRLVEAFDL